MNILYGEGGMIIEIGLRDGSVRSLQIDLLTDSIKHSEGRILEPIEDHQNLAVEGSMDAGQLISF